VPIDCIACAQSAIVYSYNITSVPPLATFIVCPEDTVIGPTILAFSDAAIVGNIIYVSGQIGSKPGTREVVEGGISAETTQTLNNIKMVLNDLGSNSDKIFKCLCMLEDINDYNEMNKAYTTFFNSRNNLPSRSTFAGSGLALGAKIEIECWATR